WDQSHGISGPNAMLVFKHLKSNIQLWARKFNASKSEEKVQLSSKIGDIERDLEADAYQKAKIKWGIEANENTKFFHGIVKKKRRDLAINGVMKNGTWFSDPGDIKDMFREFFVEKFKHFEGVDVTRRSDHYKTLSSAQVSLLEHSISEREGNHTHEISNLASFTGCTPQRLPFTYLGIPIGSNMSRIKELNPIIDKFQKRLSKWKANMLSIGGRSTLITSVLGSLRVYYLSLFPMPKLINKRLESLRANLFWGCTDRIKKIPWIAWKSVLASKVKGGLGIGSLEALNLSLLQKWRWRFFNSPQALWVKVV
ncbi:hypothetical protein Tco_1325669, partial [Tanacetum coccineum]